MIHFFLFYRMDWTEEHQGFVWAGLAATLILGCCVGGLLP